MMKENKRSLAERQESFFVTIGAVAGLGFGVLIFWMLHDVTSNQMTDDWKVILVVVLGVVIMAAMRMTTEDSKKAEALTKEPSFMEVLETSAYYDMLEEVVKVKSERIVDAILFNSINDASDISRLRFDIKKIIAEEIVRKIELTEDGEKVKLVFKDSQQKKILETKVTADELEEIFEYKED